MDILIAGESWVTHSIHQKGFDSFTTTDYVEGVEPLQSAIEAGGDKVVYQPAHIAAREFPSTAADLKKFGCVILSDMGANTLLLHPETFTKSKAMPNRLRALADYVADGGGLVMVGGYMTFQGIDGKARYHATPVEEALPVTLKETDDRIEAPEGLMPRVELPQHPIVSGITGPWPALLGLNQVSAKDNAELIATAGGYPLLVAGTFGKGRGVAFTSDCAPHWAPPAFVAWEHYNRLWSQMVRWASGG